jgi:sterol desaturase/sphingolipid hydroxylase (fatty acid hydroxylase superfamily)
MDPTGDPVSPSFERVPAADASGLADGEHSGPATRGSPGRPKAAPKPETCRMFESDLIERFSRIHPSTPFVAWVPVIGVLLYRSVRFGLSLPAIAGLFLLGALTWTLAEYVLHRYLFHWVNETAWGQRLHFLLHGVHHDYPNDKDRLVMPLGASIPFGILFYLVFLSALGVATTQPFFAGFVLGYLGYDGTHYAIHHFRPRTRLGKWLRRHHMLHHHADHEGGFGVSTPLWDLVFRTMPEHKSAGNRRPGRMDGPARA